MSLPVELAPTLVDDLGEDEVVFRCDTCPGADLIEVVQSLALVSLPSSGTLGVDEVHLGEAEEGEVQFAEVGMTAGLAVAGHVGVLIDIDTLVKVGELLDGVGRLEEQIATISRAEELGKGRCGAIATPLAIGTENGEETFLLQQITHRTVVGGTDEEGGRAVALSVLPIIHDREDDLIGVLVVVRSKKLSVFPMQFVSCGNDFLSILCRLGIVFGAGVDLSIEVNTSEECLCCGLVGTTVHLLACGLEEWLYGL